MGILEIIKSHIQTNIKDAGDIYFNFQPDVKGDCIILWQYDGIQTDIGIRPQIQIAVKNKNMQTAETLINEIYDIIYPVGQCEKSITISEEVMKIVPRQSPFYLERDDNNRHIYVFNIDCIMKRSISNGSI